MLLDKIQRKIKHIQRYLLVIFYSKRVLIEFDDKWFRGKRVAIVGGADSVLKENLGAYIDSFDVVVRTNKGVEIISKQKDFVGTKTDILIHAFFEDKDENGSSPITPELWKRMSVGTIIYAYNYRCSTYAFNNFSRFIEKTRGLLKVSQISEKDYAINARVTEPVMPTTGFVAINTIMNCQPKELYITGITFFKTPTNQQYRKFVESDFNYVFKEKKAHDADLEYSHVKKMYLENPQTVKPDATLKDIFKSH